MTFFFWEQMASQKKKVMKWDGQKETPREMNRPQTNLIEHTLDGSFVLLYTLMFY